jgi:hypothetical protein
MKRIADDIPIPADLKEEEQKHYHPYPALMGYPSDYLREIN